MELSRIFPVIFFSCYAPSSSSLFDRGETPQEAHFFRYPNVSPPSNHSTLPHNFSYPCKSRGTVFSESVVSGVLLLRGLAQIRTPIIEGISIAVIATALDSQDNVMHPQIFSVLSRIPAFRIVTPSIRCFLRKPFPLIQPFKIGRVNDGELPLCKWDETIRWVRRHNILCKQVGHIQPSKAGLMCRHFTPIGVRHAL